MQDSLSMRMRYLRCGAVPNLSCIAALATALIGVPPTATVPAGDASSILQPKVQLGHEELTSSPNSCRCSPGPNSMRNFVNELRRSTPLKWLRCFSTAWSLLIWITILSRNNTLLRHASASASSLQCLCTNLHLPFFYPPVFEPSKVTTSRKKTHQCISGLPANLCFST